jgi:predicted metal-binding protein
VELVGFTTCGGCPGGNIEYAPEEMKKNGADEKYGIPVVIGTHPIPQKYLLTHTQCGTWRGSEWPTWLKPTLADEATRKAYD